MQTFCSSYIFLLLIICWKPLQGPFLRDRTLNAPDGATVVPAEKLEPGRIFLSNFKTKHSRPREKGLERSLQTDTGGVKKDTCGVGQALSRTFSLPLVHRIWHSWQPVDSRSSLVICTSRDPPRDRAKDE